MGRRGGYRASGLVRCREDDISLTRFSVPLRLKPQRLLSLPALVIEIGEYRYRIAFGVEQGHHEHAHLAGRHHLANQTHDGYLARTLIIDGIAAVGRRQGGAGTKQAEQRRFADAASPLAIEQGQANLRRIDRQNPQVLPARCFGKVRIDQAQQLVIEQIEDIRPQTAARLRERAGGHLPGQAGSPGQQSEERIEFDLHRPADVGEQKGDQRRKGQVTQAGEKARTLPSDFEKRRALNEGCETVQYVDIFRPSYLTYKHQSVTAPILAQKAGVQNRRQKYAGMLSHEDWPKNVPQKC